MFFFFGTLILIQTAVVCHGERTCNAAEAIDVEQAGDHFVNFVLREILATRKNLPAITRAAEASSID